MREAIMLRKLKIDEIRIDGGTQMRDKTHEKVVAGYADRIKAGDQFPALQVYFDGKKYWLAEGFYRRAAHLANGEKTVDCNVHVLFGARQELWVAATDGSERRKIASLDRPGQRNFLHYAVWHPDGRYIAFDDNESIFVVDVETAEKHKVFSSQGRLGRIGVMQWSPDGKAIGFRAERGSPELWSVKNLLRPLASGS